MAALVRQYGLQFDHKQQPSLSEIHGRQERRGLGSAAGISFTALVRPGGSLAGREPPRITRRVPIHFLP
jgi:hypothetical protein